MSKGCEELLAIVKMIFPNQKIVLEYNIASKGGLFLDIYLPQLNVAFEYDGIQHSVYNQHFHSSLDAFRASKKRDLAKTTQCQELGISLVRIKHDDKMTKDLVLGKLQEALDSKEE